MYFEGEGVPKDDAKAVHRFTKAPKQGYARAQFNLGLMYAEGWGVPEDYVRAYAWVSIVAAKGHAKAKKLKVVIVSLMTPTQTAEGQKLSRELWEKYVVPFQKD